MARRVTPKLREQIKGSFDAAMKGDVQDDVGLQDFRKGQQNVMQSGTNAQQGLLNRQAMAAGGGGPVMTGQFAEAAKQIGETTQAAQAEIAGDEAQFRQGLRDARRTEALQGAEMMAKMNMEKAATAAKLTTGVVTSLATDPGVQGLIKGIYKEARGGQ